MHVEVAPCFLPSPASSSPFSFSSTSPLVQSPSPSHSMNCGAIFHAPRFPTEVFHPPRVKIDERDIWKDFSHLSPHSTRQSESTVPSLSPPSSNIPYYPFQNRAEPLYSYAHHQISPKCYPPPPPFQAAYQAAHQTDNFKKNLSPKQTPPAPFHPPPTPVYHTFIPYSPAPQQQQPTKPIIPTHNNDPSPLSSVLQETSRITSPRSLNPSAPMDINNADMVKQLEELLAAEHAECIQVLLLSVQYIFFPHFLPLFFFPGSYFSCFIYFSLICDNFSVRSMSRYVLV